MFKPIKPLQGSKPVEQVVDDPVMRVGGLKFGIFSEQEVKRQAQIQISDKNLYDATGQKVPQNNGPLDYRLGTTSKTDTCPTCGKDQSNCNGHWGYIRLQAPCFHVGFLPLTIEILNQICKTCSSVLLPEVARRQQLRALRRPGMDQHQRKAALKKIQLDCRKIKRCPHCGATNGPIRKVPNHACKIVHLKFEHYNKSTAKKKQPPNDKVLFDDSLASYVKKNPDMDRFVKKVIDDLLPLKVWNLFHHISAEDCELLGIDLTLGRPESYLWTYIPVPPPCIRPSVPSESATVEDDLTIKLQEIVDINTRFKAALEREEHITMWMDLYEKLQDHLVMYINSHAPGLNKMEYGKAIRSFCTRLKGKQGRFRGNLSGKRVNYSARTVIGPDPNLSVEEVGMPVHVAKVLSYPERVNSRNIATLRERVKRGASKYPGANSIQSKGLTRSMKALEHNQPLRDTLAQDLGIGDIVDRHIIDGDIVLFNRQPSLHKLSILCHRVRVHPGRTFRLNESVCNPYNADFDGDEMNIHVPQTEEARTEAIQLMGVKTNLVTPKNGAPIIAPIQDFITTSYLLSQKDRFFTRGEFAQLVGYMFDATDIFDPDTRELRGYELPPPTLLKPMFLWTGKQVFSVLMRPNRATKVLVNVEAQCRQYKPATTGLTTPDLNEDDAYLVVRNSIVMCGVLDKSIIGDGKKCSIFYAMLRDYGEDYAVQGMNRLAKLSARWLGSQGFSIGIGDVYPSEKLEVEKRRLMEDAKARCQEHIESWIDGRLTRDPGCDKEMTLENRISSILSQVRQDAGQACFDELNRYNAAVVMAKSGSKGSMINVSQMVAGVGQQMISGKRVEDGFQDRTLPHFRKGSRDPDSKGFVENSFFSGLTPSEFIFHAMSGREGLVDTAVKTAETGYMSRRLIKSLEDASVSYDNTIRVSNGSIVQFAFGDDSLDPAELEGQKEAVDFDKTWVHALETTYDIDSIGLDPEKVMALSESSLSAYREKHNLQSPSDIDDARFTAADDQQASNRFVNSLSSFIQTKSTRLQDLHAMYGAVSSAERIVSSRSGRVEYGSFQARRALVDKFLKITPEALDEFVSLCLQKYERCKVQPGLAVGAIAAQSIGEPGTQMTLKTFHFAGVAGMSITQGVPRIKEIINAAKRISTPVITCPLFNPQSLNAAREVKSEVEKTYLRDIVCYIDEQWSGRQGLIWIKIDKDVVKNLNLRIKKEDIATAICKSKGIGIKRNDVQFHGEHHILITPNEAEMFGDLDFVQYATPAQPLVMSKKKGIFKRPPISASARARGKKAGTYYLHLQQLCRDIGNIVVKGYPDTTRAIIKKGETRKTTTSQEADGSIITTTEKVQEYTLLIEGYGLKAVMNTPMVDGHKTNTNNVMEVHQVLGIEAARAAIIKEMNAVMGQMDIDTHHIALLACTMTCRGEVLGITRFGMAKLKDSVLQLASFEKTPDHLFEAAARMKEDDIKGVSESIIMGQPVRLGTGIARVVRPLNLTMQDLRTKESLFATAVRKDQVAAGWEGSNWKGIGYVAPVK